MGLDMFLRGRKFYRSAIRQRPQEDGFDIVQKDLDIGYWRKHPNLHGYIIEHFADGVDECQDIELGPDQIDKIIKAVRAGNLPHTEGFFFGTSSTDEGQMIEDLSILQGAYDWLKKPDESVWKSVIYRASW
jgi:hypothetical protein